MLIGADFRLTEQGMIYSPIYETQYLPGMTVELYAQEDIIVNGTVMYEAGELVDTQATTADAPAVFEGLYPGSYLYRETIAPDGFFIGANEGVIRLEPGGQEEIVETATVYNERQKARIVFWKEWEENPVYPNPDVWQDMSFGLFASEDILDIYGNVAIEAGSLVDVGGESTSTARARSRSICRPGSRGMCRSLPRRRAMSWTILNTWLHSRSPSRKSPLSAST